MEVWKIVFLSKGVICTFHVNLPGCSLDGQSTAQPPQDWDSVSHPMKKSTHVMFPGPPTHSKEFWSSLFTHKNWGSLRDFKGKL